MTQNNGDSPHNLPDGGFGSARWAGIQRDYSFDEVARLRGSVVVRHSLSEA